MRLAILSFLIATALADADEDVVAAFKEAQSEASRVVFGNIWPDLGTELKTFLTTPLNPENMNQEFATNQIKMLCSSINQVSQTSSMSFIDFFGISVRSKISAAVNKVDSVTPLLVAFQNFGRAVAKWSKSLVVPEVKDAMKCVADTKSTLKKQADLSRKLGATEICFIVFTSLVVLYAAYLFSIPKEKLRQLIAADREAAAALV